MDHHIETLEPMLHHDTIRHPGALRVLFNAIPDLPGEHEVSSMRRYFIYKLFERLCAKSHRNHAVISSLNLVSPLFDAFCPPRSTDDDASSGTTTPLMPKPERQVLMRLLRKLLELGCSSDDARSMFKRALIPRKSIAESVESLKDEAVNGLNADVLEVLRAGMKARWPQHFSLQRSAALKVMVSPSDKSLPKTGFTLMVGKLLVLLCDVTLNLETSLKLALVVG